MVTPKEFDKKSVYSAFLDNYSTVSKGKPFKDRRISQLFFEEFGFYPSIGTKKDYQALRKLAYTTGNGLQWADEQFKSKYDNSIKESWGLNLSSDEYKKKYQALRQEAYSKGYDLYWGDLRFRKEYGFDAPKEWRSHSIFGGDCLKKQEFLCYCDALQKKKKQYDQQWIERKYFEEFNTFFLVGSREEYNRLLKIAYQEKRDPEWAFLEFIKKYVNLPTKEWNVNAVCDGDTKQADKYWNYCCEIARKFNHDEDWAWEHFFTEFDIKDKDFFRGIPREKINLTVEKSTAIASLELAKKEKIREKKIIQEFIKIFGERELHDSAYFFFKRTLTELNEEQMDAMKSRLITRIAGRNPQIYDLISS